jgi:sec-independent protein translocase protein TatA
MFKSFGWPEALVILVIVLVIFGAGKLPSIGGALGKSIREFRKAKDGVDEEMKDKSKDKSDTTKEIAETGTKTKQS